MVPLIEVDPEPLDLPGLEVVGIAQVRYLERVGVYERSRRGIGVHLLPEEIASRTALRTSEYLRRVPSILLVRGVEPVSRRGGKAFDATGTGCRPDVVVDGTYVRQGGACGTIVIWTKR
jgi:hypothetical protein